MKPPATSQKRNESEKNLYPEKAEYSNNHQTKNGLVIHYFNGVPRVRIKGGWIILSNTLPNPVIKKEMGSIED